MSEPLRLFGQPADTEALDWPWVQQQLEAAPTYWVNTRSAGPSHPHPRPVWGIWHERDLYLSVGSLVLVRQLASDPVVTVHVDSGTDVVIVEGTAVDLSVDQLFLERYNTKYDWNYVVDEYGPLTHVVATAVIAWRSAGWAGRGGIRSSGRWRMPS